MFTNDQARLADDASLLDLGVIDSTGVLELVLVIEENFAMQVKDSAMVPENFDSVDRIVSFVMRSKAA
ncbi:MAG: acyl carrier protein [Pseudoxanthomonas mexicana]|nr:acyl carrier protein [Pseudoxanthomonas mexicana]